MNCAGVLREDADVDESGSAMRAIAMWAAQEREGGDRTEAHREQDSGPKLLLMLVRHDDDDADDDDEAHHAAELMTMMPVMMMMMLTSTLVTMIMRVMTSKCIMSAQSA